LNPIAIRGIGTAVPPHSIQQEDAAEVAKSLQYATAKSAASIGTLYRRAGVDTRHSVLLEVSTNGQPARQSFFPAACSSDDRGPALSQRMQRYEHGAGELVIEAAKAAFTSIDIAAEEITHLVTASCTGFAAPGFDLEMQAVLPISPSVARTHLGFMGCHALLNALRVAHAFIQADHLAKVLVATVELCSLHQQYGCGKGRVVSNSLFADGAAALICSAPPSEPTTSCWSLLASGSTIVPGTESDLTWKLGDHGFEMMLSPRIPRVIRKHLRPWLVKWLARRGVTLSDVRHWAVHPGGPRILDAVEESLDLSPADLTPSRQVLHRYGNMSSPTVAFVLESLGTIRDEGLCVALAFGPGLTIEAALLS
jgi:predicted naringenin-chalcone synthase